jgi:Type I phosphodiesterase / nucleotide pyrophosphatase
MFTAVGHATQFTGGNSPQHGLAGNDWHDESRGGQVYCVEDDWHPIIGKEPKAHEGTSPRNLTASTHGDELILASGGRSRVFSVSIKDRGAILPGGRLGKAAPSRPPARSARCCTRLCRTARAASRQPASEPRAANHVMIDRPVTSTGTGNLSAYAASPSAWVRQHGGRR